MDPVENDIMLIKHALYELAERIGDTQIEPKSFSLLCLLYEVPWVAQSKLVVMCQELSKRDYSDMCNKDALSLFRDKMSEIVPQAREFTDLTVYSFLRVISIDYVEELYPLTCMLKEDFLVNSEL